MSKRLELTPFQRGVLSASADVDIVFNLGGRGSGKTTLNIFAALRHADKYAEHARILIVRKTQAALAELEDELERFLIAAYGTEGFTRNRNMHEFRLGNGAVIRAECLDYMTPATMARLVGQSQSFLVLEEVGQFGDEKVIDQLFSNLRAPSHVKCQAWMSANPGGIGAGWLRRRTIDQCPAALTPYVEKETGLRCLYSLSTFRDNPKLDPSYEARLRASVATDPALQGAWVDGSFDKVSGALFDIFDPSIHIIEPWARLPAGAWDFRLGMDWGGVSPSVAELLAVARADALGADDRRYSTGSAIVLGEVSSAIAPSVTQGDGCSPSEFADRIKEELLEPFGLRARDLRVLAGDPQINQRSAGRRSYSVGDEFRDNGLRFTSANRTNRPARLQQIRSLLDGALREEAKPGLFICRGAANLIQTLPTLQRSVHRPNDLDVRSPKHALDALSYGLATTSRGSVTRVSNGNGSRYSRRQRELDEIEGIKV